MLNSLIDPSHRPITALLVPIPISRFAFDVFRNRNDYSESLSKSTAKELAGKHWDKNLKRGLRGSKVEC